MRAAPTHVISGFGENVMKQVQLKDAEATLSALIDDARRGEPSIITRQGQPEAVVVGFEDWQRAVRLRSFGQFLWESPFEESDVPARGDTPMRPADL